jgi:hypothetical protein
MEIELSILREQLGLASSLVAILKKGATVDLLGKNS